jgi:ABC-type multidrug transport system fused ATPase/permease subunit
VKQILKNTWTVLTNSEKKRFSLLVIFDIIVSVADIFLLAVLLWIIQFYIQPASTNRMQFLPAWLVNKNSVSFIAVFFFIFALKNIAAFFVVQAQYRLVADVAVRISSIGLSNYQQASFEEFIQVDSSVQVRRISLQPFEFSQYILSGIQQIITQAFLIVLTIVAIVLFNAKLFFLLLCMLLPPVIAVFYILKKKLNDARAQIRSNNEKSFQYMLDALKGYVEGNIYDKNDFFRERFLSVRKKFSKYLFASISLQSIPGRIIEIFAVLGLFVLIVIAHWSGSADSASLITIGAFMAAAYKIIPGVVRLMNILGQIKTYEFPIEELLKKDKAELRQAGGFEISHIQSLCFKNISFRYGSLPVLKDLSFGIQKGDMVAIKGKSGKGKTTIFNVLLGFLSPSEGHFVINGNRIDPRAMRSAWNSISYVRQQSFFIHDSVLKNITLDEKEYDEGRLANALKISGLEDMLKQFPEGIEKIITENGKNISGGQQQRIAIARALYKEADLYLLDEPFNELDESSERTLLKHFRHLAGLGKMVLLITHDKNAIAYCNKTISLDEE